MQPNPRFWCDKTVCITGGTGFLGSALVQQLRGLAAHVRVFGLRPRNEKVFDRIRDLDCVFADVRDAQAVRQAVRDSDVVLHTAGSVALWGPALKAMHSIHIEGTRNVLAALPRSARMVHTSSVVAIGASLGPALLTECSPFRLQSLKIDYVHAKKAAEDLALAAGERGQSVVVVNPGYLIGPDDYEGSVVGRFCLRCWRGKVPLIPAGAMNFVDVRDVALGHLLAAERGVSGRRYILGGENLTMVEFSRALAKVRGRSSRWWCRMPQWLHYLVASGAELHAQFVAREPYPSRQLVRLNGYHWYYNSARAGTELGYQSRPFNSVLEDMYEWYCREGLLKPLLSETVPRRSEQEQRDAA